MLGGLGDAGFGLVQALALKRIWMVYGALWGSWCAFPRQCTHTNCQPNVKFNDTLDLFKWRSIIIT